MSNRTIATAVFSLGLALLFIVLLPGWDSGLTRASSGHQAWAGRMDPPSIPGSLAGPTGTLTSTYQYMPFASYTPPPAIELLDVWIDDSEGVEQQGFLPGDNLVYNSFGLVNRNHPLTATVTLNTDGPCEDGLIYSDTLSLPSGSWIFPVPSQAQSCTGLFTTTTTIRHEELAPTLSTQHVVNLPSQVVVSQGAGFDKCAVPSVEKMQTWWDESPYSVVNIYLGGVLFACPGQELDAVWVYKVARQGWTFIPTWVGPQPPCTGYSHKMNSDPQEAYLEGKVEAAAAAVAARHQGLFGEQVIYYDIEAYPNASDACRAATDAFLRGWAEQLHDLGLKAGGYGQPCSSYVSDWVDNSPPPDDVWLASWVTNYYSPTVTVQVPYCVPDNYWDDHQRIRQYTGGHSETWGGVSVTIDSNVLDGEVTSLPVVGLGERGALQPVRLVRQPPQIQQAGLLGPGNGWVLADGRILLTEDGGKHWRDITPGADTILDLEISNLGNIWLALMGDGLDGIRMAHSEDGGASWDFYPLPLDSQGEIGSIDIAYLDTETQDGSLWVMLRQKSGASFSRGILFLSDDGGLTWQRRTAPVGDPVEFLDVRRGWSAGGPAGDLLYYTEDGGRTWSQLEVPIPADSPITVGLPRFEGAQNGLLPVFLDGTEGGEVALFETRDGGRNWAASDRPILRLPNFNPASLLLKPGFDQANPLFSRLPEAAVLVDTIDDLHAWVVIQESSCRGDKRIADESAVPDAGPFECTQRWGLLESEDGGRSWREVPLPAR